MARSKPKTRKYKGIVEFLEKGPRVKVKKRKK